MKRKIIHTKKAPQPIGAYSQGVLSGDTLYISGQVPIDPGTGNLVGGDFKKSARQVLENIRGILEAAGMSFEDIVKTTVFLKDLNDFADLNEIFHEYFQSEPPARSAIEAGRLPKDVPLEIEAVAQRRSE